MDLFAKEKKEKYRQIGEEAKVGDRDSVEKRVRARVHRFAVSKPGRAINGRLSQVDIRKVSGIEDATDCGDPGKHECRTFWHVHPNSGVENDGILPYDADSVKHLIQQACYRPDFLIHFIRDSGGGLP